VGRPADAHLANIVGALALALADRMRDATEEAAGQSATAPSALVALHEFLGHGTMDQLRLAIGLTPSGAVRLVDRLVQAGYVEREPGADKRSVALVLSPSGRTAARRVLRARSAALDGVLLGLSAAERTALTNITEKLLAAETRERLAGRDRGRVRSGGWLCRQCDFDACGRDQGMCPAAATAGGY
jgi:MarR family transcriptional repressor of emrRAB